MKVVTYQTTSGEGINICPSCARKLRAAHEWPRGRKGEEYCQVSFGLHEGRCDIHQPAKGSY